MKRPVDDLLTALPPGIVPRVTGQSRAGGGWPEPVIDLFAGRDAAVPRLDDCMMQIIPKLVSHARFESFASELDTAAEGGWTELIPFGGEETRDLTWASC